MVQTIDDGFVVVHMRDFFDHNTILRLSVHARRQSITSVSFLRLRSVSSI